ncbi:MAG: DUF2865 domain-containing protein [Rhizobiaceae bacterium]
MIAPLAVAFVTAFASPAQADQRACRKLEAQLSALGGGSAQHKKYDKAVEAQKAQLGKARGQAREAGCMFTFLGGGSERCGSLKATISRMERNLLALQNKRAQLAGAGSSRAEKSRLVAAIETAGCRDQRVARAPSPRDDGSLFDRLFGGGIKERERLADPYEPERVSRVIRPGSTQGFGSSGGPYRTLCVRTCDGYYFPISGSSAQSDFERDQKNCEAMCPGTEVRLYHHLAATEESESMVSVADGSPYTEMPVAFRYRDVNAARDASCGCNPVKYFSIIAGEPRAPAEPAEQFMIPQPTPKPDAGADPETLANAEGGLTADVIRDRLRPKPAEEPKTSSTEAGRIRVVGPAFLPDPEGAIDLRAPGQKQLQ